MRVTLSYLGVVRSLHRSKKRSRVLINVTVVFGVIVSNVYGP